MTITPLEVRKKIAVTLTANTGNSVVSVVEIVPFQKPGYRTVGEWHEVNELLCINWIQNLAMIEYPVFELEDSDSKRDLALLDLQWKSPRIHLNLYLETDGQDRERIDVTGLLSVKPYPYAKIPLGNFPLGDNSTISVALQNVGHGLLQGSDKVTITGDLISHITVEKISEGRVITNSITTTPAIIIPQNSERQGFTIFNGSEYNIYLDIVNTLSTTSFLAIIGAGEYYESPFTVVDNVYMITDSVSPVSIQIREFI